MERELLVRVLATDVANWVLGEYENTIQDGQMAKEDMPDDNELVEIIYEEVLASKYVTIKGKNILIEKDIRFLTTTRLKEIIYQQLQMAKIMG